MGYFLHASFRTLTLKFKKGYYCNKVLTLKVKNVFLRMESSVKERENGSDLDLSLPVDAFVLSAYQLASNVLSVENLSNLLVKICSEQGGS